MVSSRSLRKNIASLGVLQAFNFVLTLSTLPYLARTLGAAGWGQVVFIQMVINYLSWVANWGFYLGATKQVAAQRDSPVALSRIFTTTWTAQWCLTVVLILGLALGLSLAPTLGGSRELYVAGAGILIGNALTPLWYLNGLEKIRESALIQIAVKILALPMVFWLVRRDTDAVTYLMINSVCSIAVGIATSVWIFRSKVIRFVLPDWREVWSTITQEFQLFTSTLWANLNGALIPTVLGIVSGPAELGYYNLADRVRGAAITILHPITHALFPRMCYLFSNDQAQAMRLLKRSGMALLVLSGSLSGVLLLSSSQILNALGGDAFQRGSTALMWLAVAPVFATASSFLIHQILIPLGATRGYERAMLATLVFTAIIAFPATKLLGSQGAAVASLTTEAFTALFLIRYVQANKLLRV